VLSKGCVRKNTVDELEIDTFGTNFELAVSPDFRSHLIARNPVVTN
jgi:hypothetical protein